MILRVRTPDGDVRDIDHGPVPVAADRGARIGGGLVVGTSGARIDDPEKRRERNARRATTRAGRAA